MWKCKVRGKGWLMSRSRVRLIEVGRQGSVKSILHYALGLRFGKVCEQKREQKC